MFYCLKDMGVHAVYRDASTIIQSRGFSQNLTYDPYAKSVDICGAVILACGGSEKLLAEGETEPQNCGIPDGKLGTALIAIEYMEAMLGKDASDWCTDHAIGDVVKMFKKLSDRIEMSVVRQTD